MIIKALSLKQPWANLVASGAKTIETRTWRTAYRGPLLICASKTYDYTSVTYLNAQGFKMLAPVPAGLAVALVDLVDCRDMVHADIGAACCRTYPGAKAWILENIRKIEPFGVSGMPGIFPVDLSRHYLPQEVERFRRIYLGG